MRPTRVLGVVGVKGIGRLVVGVWEVEEIFFGFGVGVETG